MLTSYSMTEQTLTKSRNYIYLLIFIKYFIKKIENKTTMKNNNPNNRWNLLAQMLHNWEETRQKKRIPKLTKKIYKWDPTLLIGTVEISSRIYWKKTKNSTPLNSYSISCTIISSKICWKIILKAIIKIIILFYKIIPQK